MPGRCCSAQSGAEPALGGCLGMAPPGSASLLTASLFPGYFLEDFVDMLCNQKLHQSWELLFHHSVVSPLVTLQGTDPGTCSTREAGELAVACVGVCYLLQHLIFLPGERSLAAQSAGLRAPLGPVGLVYSSRVCRKAPKYGVVKNSKCAQRQGAESWARGLIMSWTGSE